LFLSAARFLFWDALDLSGLLFSGRVYRLRGSGFAGWRFSGRASFSFSSVHGCGSILLLPSVFSTADFIARAVFLTARSACHFNLLPPVIFPGSAQVLHFLVENLVPRRLPLAFRICAGFPRLDSIFAARSKGVRLLIFPFFSLVEFAVLAAQVPFTQQGRPRFSFSCCSISWRRVFMPALGPVRFFAPAPSALRRQLACLSVHYIPTPLVSFWSACARLQPWPRPEVRFRSCFGSPCLVFYPAGPHARDSPRTAPGLDLSIAPHRIHFLQKRARPVFDPRRAGRQSSICAGFLRFGHRLARSLISLRLGSSSPEPLNPPAASSLPVGSRVCSLCSSFVLPHTGSQRQVRPPRPRTLLRFSL
jgi:hypothetical protein